MNLKIIHVILFFSALLSGCGTGIEDEEEETTTQQKEVKEEDKHAVKVLDKEAFKKNVFDFENSTQWQFAGNKPCLVEFYADWCGPCRMMAPTLEDLAKEYRNSINIYKVNIDKEKDLAYFFGVRGIPMILFCPLQGKPQVAKGMLSKTALKEAIDTLLLHKQSHAKTGKIQ